MSKKHQDLWFSDLGRQYQGEHPLFYSPSQFSWVKQLEENWQEIRNELQEVLHKETQLLEPYMNTKMTSKANKWKTAGLMFWTIRSKSQCEKFPKTWEIIKDIPNLSAASFNLLGPNTTIKPHYGNTNAIIRCHLGLSIPAEVPSCGFRVGDESQSWSDGKLLMFCDAHTHTAWNNTNKDRYVMVIDVFRPEYRPKTAAIASRVLSSIYSEVKYQNSKVMAKLASVSLIRKSIFNAYRAYYFCYLKLFGFKATEQ